MRLRLPETLWPAGLDARPLTVTAVANLAIAACGVLTGVLAARLLGADGRGQLAAAQAWPLLLASLGGCGLTEATAYFVARRPLDARVVLSTGLVLSIPFCAAAAITGLWILPIVLHAQPPDVLVTARISLLVVPLAILASAPYQAVRGAGRYRAWNVLRLATPFAWLIALAGAPALGYADVRSVAIAFLLATAVSACAAHACAWMTLPGSRKPDAGLARPMLGYGAPTMLAGMPQWLNLRLDQLVMIAILDTRAIGLYAVAVAWGTAAQPLAGAFANVAVPLIARAEDRRETARLVYRAGTAVSLMTGGAVVLVTPGLLPWIFGAEFAAAVPAAVVMGLAGAVTALNAVGAECLRGMGRPRATLLAECAGLLVTVVTLPVLIMTAGIVGAAIASLLSYLAILVAQRWMMRMPGREPQLAAAA